MSTAFLFLLGRNPAAPIRWARTVDAKILECGDLSNAGAIGEIVNKIGPSDEVIAILPGEQVAFRTMLSPPRNGKNFKKAAQYLLEDEVGESVDELHIATSTSGGNGSILAIKVNVIAAWCDRFLKHGIDLDAITADYLCLPAPDDGVFILFDEGRTIAARSDAGFAIDSDLAAIALPEIIGASAVANISAVGDQIQASSLLPAGADYLGPVDNRQMLMLFADGVRARSPLNLLQGRFRKQREWKSGVAVWQRAGAIAAAASIVFAALIVTQGLRANRTTDLFQERAHALHKQTFPDAAEANPEEHARNILSTGGTGAGFLMISAKVAEALDDMETVDIERVRFDAARGQYVLSVVSETDVDIENLRRGLAALGVSAEDSGGYRRSGDVWVGDMTVSVR